MKVYKLITNQDSENIQRYFNEIKDIEPLTKEEEHVLIERIQKHNDQQALNKLVRANLKFVISMAKKYQNQGVPLLDLISEGNTGLIEAAYRFDSKAYDIKFYSYAVWWITINIIKQFNLNARTIQMPSNRTELLNKVKKELVILESELGRRPTMEEMAESLKRFNALKKLTENDILEVLMYEFNPMSLQQPAGNNRKFNDVTDTTIEDFIEAENTNKDTDSLSKEIDRYLYHLTQNQADILTLVMGLHGEPVVNTETLSHAFQISKSEIQKIKMRAIKRLKKLKNIDKLNEFVDE